MDSDMSAIIGTEDFPVQTGGKKGMQKHGQMLVGLRDAKTEAHMPALGIPNDLSAKAFRE